MHICRLFPLIQHLLSSLPLGTDILAQEETHAHCLFSVETDNQEDQIRHARTVHGVNYNVIMLNTKDEIECSVQVEL